MSKFYLRHFHIGQLISGAALRLNPAAAAQSEAGNKARPAAANSYKRHAAAAAHELARRSTRVDPLAVLDASKRRWPSRYC